MQETWVVLQDERYRVSNLGRVGRKRGGLWVLAKQYSLQSGYLTVCAGGKMESVHRLVALAFLGLPSADKGVVNHKDGDKTNNRADNLEWVTRSENMQHAVSVLGRMRGVRKNKKLSPEGVISVRDMRSAGMTMEKIAERHGISYQLVSAIISGREWAWVKSDHIFAVRARARSRTPAQS